MFLFTSRDQRGKAKKIAPIYLTKILKAATELAINNLEDAAFLSTIEISFFLDRHFSFKDTSGETIVETKSH